VAEEATSRAPAPDAVGRAIAGVLASSSPAFRTIVGHDARALVALRQLVPDRLFASGVRFFQRQKRGPDRPAATSPQDLAKGDPAAAVRKRGSRISER
jgi:hypothetical protein